MREGAILDQRYRIDAKLAEGGFGAIYRATDLVMGRHVALKVLHRDLAGDASVVERFRREAAALAKLRDPHTVTMYDVGESADGTRYIVMELLRGDSLHEQFHAHGKHLPWRRVVAIARGVCSSLREAHTIGIVHRDLKPANIHLEKHPLGTDYVKVLDFGIAKVVDGSEPNRDLTLHGQMIGTFDYMAPEQMIGGMCTGKSDVFTLGIVIYEMIAGERPYGDAKGPVSMLMAVLGTTPIPLGERTPVPDELEAIVMRAIQHDPDLRPDIFELDETLAMILDATLDGQEPRAAAAAQSATTVASGAAAGTHDALEDDARFGDDDGPTWIDAAKPLRITPTNVRPTPNSLRPPAKRATLSSTRPNTDDTYKAGAPPPGGQSARVTRQAVAAPAPTMLGTFAPDTPARGLPSVPLPPVLPQRPSPAPTKPTEFAVGSATQIPPVPPTAPGRMPSGTSPIVNEQQIRESRVTFRSDNVRPPDRLPRAESRRDDTEDVDLSGVSEHTFPARDGGGLETSAPSRDAVVLTVVYLVLAALVAVGIYLMY